jgi:hypothetical protein
MTLVRPLARTRVPARGAPPATTGDSTARWSREWICFSIAAAAWCITPLIRRLIDFHNGAFNPVQITSLVPFALMLPLAFACTRPGRLARVPSLLRWLAGVWVAVFTYGFLIAFAAGDVAPALFTFAEYLAPMVGGIWIASEDVSVEQCFRRLALMVLPCAAVAAIYGVVQWIQPPPWDVMWVEGADFQTAGLPEPFVMRVFSTLNSPGTAGDFFALALLLALPALRLRKYLWVWPLLTILGCALLLTQVREAWIGLIVGVAAYLVLSPRRMSALPLLAAYAAVLGMLIVALPSFVGSGQDADLLSSRVSTLTDIGHDESAIDRQMEISEGIDAGLRNPVGTGLGVLGSASKIGANPAMELGTIIDSGYLTRFIELGYLGTLGYLFVVLGGPLILAYRLARRSAELNSDVKVVVAVALAFCAFLAWGDAADEAHFGIEGLFFWLGLGLASAASVSGDVRAAASPLSASVRRRN